jgi:DnaJ-class molecular chaperone
LDIEAELEHLEQLLLAAAAGQQQPAGSKRHAVALSAQQRQKRHRVLTDSEVESEVDEDLECAADGEWVLLQPRFNHAYTCNACPGSGLSPRVNVTISCQCS